MGKLMHVASHSRRAVATTNFFPPKPLKLKCCFCLLCGNSMPFLGCGLGQVSRLLIRFNRRRNLIPSDIDVAPSLANVDVIQEIEKLLVCTAGKILAHFIHSNFIWSDKSFPIHWQVSFEMKKVCPSAVSNNSGSGRNCKVFYSYFHSTWKNGKSCCWKMENR